MHCVFNLFRYADTPAYLVRNLLTIRYDTIRDASITCARKLSLPHGTTTKKCKTKKTKSRKQICLEITVNSPGIHVVNI